jgi:ankyrin repeat protein
MAQNCCYCCCSSHFACRNEPPVDVLEVFVSLAVETLLWPDFFGWLPIHYLCACGASPDAIKLLAESCPESKTVADKRGRTPLHFAIGRNSEQTSANVVFLLCNTGAAGFADDNGMLPLHYACAYGANEEVLYVLTDAYPDAISMMDKRHRTRKSSASALPEFASQVILIIPVTF